MEALGNKSDNNTADTCPQRKDRRAAKSRERRVSPCTPGLFRRTRVGVRLDFVSLLFHNATQLAFHGFKCVMDDFF